MKKFFLEVSERWNSESPSFWKNVMKISLTLGGAALGIITANAQFDLEALGVAPIIFKISGYVLTWCGALGLAAKLTIKPQEKEN